MLSLPRSVISRPKPAKILPALAIFAREPIPGKAKTRLIPLLGPRGAADFHAALVSDALQKVNALGRRVAPYFFIAGRKFPVSSSLSDYTLRRQRGADLGERLENAFRAILKHHRRVLVTGTDSPLLSGRNLLQAFEKLRVSDAVIGPCPDGGFYLIGFRRTENGLFKNVRWGSERAFEDMRANLQSRGFSCAILGAVDDVDRAEDVERLKDALVESAAARRLAPSSWRFLREFFALKAAGRRARKIDSSAPPAES
jgi:uncharacterized protein